MIMRMTFLALLMTFPLANAAMATCPLLDTVEYEGNTYGLAHWTGAPTNKKVLDWIRTLPSCSAIGQGRAAYRVDDIQVFLVMFRGCGPTLSVSEAFPGADSKMLAVWLNGKLEVARGPCTGRRDLIKEYFIVENGVLREFVQIPNQNVVFP